MSILQHFEVIRKIFYFFGLAPWLGAIDRKHKFLFRCLPVLLSVLSSICLATWQFISYYLASYGLIAQLINYTFFTCVLFTNVTANFQCWHHESIYHSMIHRIEKLENACNSKFSRKISHKSIKRHNKTNAILILGTFSISGAIVLGQAWLIGDNPTTTFLLASSMVFKQSLCALSVVHFTLYVDVVREFIAELNEQIRSSPISLHASHKIDFLKRVKSMHMDVFLLMKQVNNFFGWQLLTLVINYLVLIIYSAYWLFLTIQRNGKGYSIAGKLLVYVFQFQMLIIRRLFNGCKFLA